MAGTGRAAQDAVQMAEEIVGVIRLKITGLETKTS
jgi:hypothetical protein